MTEDAAIWPPVPACFTGVRQRSLLEAPGIESDVTSRVFWLQTTHWHGDLRLPAGRPDFSGCSGLSDTTLAQRGWLARQQGFAGQTEVRPVGGADRGGDRIPATTCQWHRQIDFQPPRSDRDIGTMVFVDAGWQVEEYELDQVYHETWRRLPESVGPTSAWQRPSLRRHADREILLIAGACFIVVVPHRDPWPADTIGSNLADLLDAGAAPDRLEMELSFGRFDPHADSCTILHSTLPWREGCVESAIERWEPLG